MKEVDKIKAAKEYIEERVEDIPETAAVMGSGWGSVLECMEVVKILNFHEIPFFPCPTVKEHDGKMLFGKIESVPVAVLLGRVHYYEGYSMEEVVRPVRVLSTLGVKKIILTNSAGAINQDFTVGDIVFMKDQISSFVPNPLRGENLDEIGTRFPDMTYLYNTKIIEKIENMGTKNHIKVKRGVYLQTSGPSFETPAEIQMYKNMGADMVGMSTACEAIAAKHAKMDVCGISFISNMASGLTKEECSMEEVVKNTGELSDSINYIIKLVIKNL